MYFEEDILEDKSDSDFDLELNEIINKHNFTSTHPQSSKSQKKPSEFSKKLDNRSLGRKTQMPQQFQKAKRTLNRIVNNYFIQLKHEYERVSEIIEKSSMTLRQKKGAVHFYLKKDKIQAIVDSISQYVGINHCYNSVMDLRYGYLQQTSKKNPYQSRRGAFCYLPESKKIVGLNLKGQIVDFNLTTKIKDFKYPQYATPIPYKDNFYFLDPARISKADQVFLSDQYQYKINDKCQVQILQSKPLNPRIKCAITKDPEFVYLFGGSVGPNRLPSNSCEQFSLKLQKFVQMPSLTKRHRCPSVCILKNIFWLFSANGIEYLPKNGMQWTFVDIPFGLSLLPFQFVVPYSENQILIFGGLNKCFGNKDFKIYNCHYNWVDVFHEALPLPVCNQKIWGPSYYESSLTILSGIQASNEPFIQEKNNTVQAIHCTRNGIILQSIKTLQEQR